MTTPEIQDEPTEVRIGNIAKRRWEAATERISLHVVLMLMLRRHH
jgi:hypothetical protein